MRHAAMLWGNVKAGIGGGNDGITPHIGLNGNWYIGDTDTGVKAKGDDGKSVELQTAGGYVQWRQTGGSWANLFKIPADGDPGQNAFLYVAYASDDQGSDFSLIPSNSLKYRAEIQRTAPLVPPVAGDFSGATWVKYIGDDGGGGPGGAEPPELFLDFEEEGDEFIYNVPYKMKFVSQNNESTNPVLSPQLNTVMNEFDRLTVTATARGLVRLYGEYVE